MPRICSIHQPSVWPFLGRFDKIARSDVFVSLDDVQYVKNEYKNRNRLFLNAVKSPQREVVGWLTLPVRAEKLEQTIRDSRVTQVPQTFRKHLVTLQQAYGRAPGFDEVWPKVEGVYRRFEREALSLADINEAMERVVIELLGIQTEWFGPASKITEKSSDPTQRLIDICKHVGADTYLAGAGGQSYMKAAEFERQGIKLIWQEWHPSPYPQVHSPEKFVPYLAALDLLFNCGASARNHYQSR